MPAKSLQILQFRAKFYDVFSSLLDPGVHKSLLNNSSKIIKINSLKMQLNFYLHFLFQFFIIFACTQKFVTCDNKRSVKVEEDEDMRTLQKGRTRRTIWLDKKRRLILPPDTSLSITPILAFPLFKQSSTWVAFENLQIQWTFLVLFQGLGWTSNDNAWPLDVSFLIPNMTESDGKDNSQNKRKGSSQAASVCNRRNGKKYDHSGCGRNIPIMALPTYTPGGERATLFPRIEKFLSSFGINGRTCLQRAVCEVHEIPLKHGFGLLGEVFTLFLTVTQSEYANSHLPGYLNAERAGKFGDCSSYYEKCPYSIFTSK